MRKKILCMILGVALVSSVFNGCGKEATKEKETLPIKTEATSSEEETGTLDTTDDEISKSETTGRQETTTVKQETTTVKQETTTAKQETTTTKKQETTNVRPKETTAKQEIVTTKKQETTDKQEETTKKEETTTQVAEVEGTWFEKKGYTITTTEDATKLTRQARQLENLHECTLEIYTQTYTDEYFTEGCDSKCAGVTGWCYEGHDQFAIIPFDRYTGIVYFSNCTSVELDVDGKKVSFQWDVGMGAGYSHYEGAICPIDYNGVVFLFAKREDVTYKGEELEKGKRYTIDEVYDFNVDDVFFLSVDDK